MALQEATIPGVTELDPERLIPSDEFRDRQTRARAAAAERGLEGLVVWSRGGGPIDQAADLVYLSNFYTQQPFIADHVGIGSARCHGALILPVEGPSILVIDIPWWRKELTVADDVRPGNDVVPLVTDALRSARLEGRKVGVVGASMMTAAAYLGMLEGSSTTEFVRTDTLIEGLRIYKSEAEVAAIRAAVSLGSAAVSAAFDVIAPGVTEADAAAEAAYVIAKAGGAWYDAPCGSGPNSHFFTWARMPSWDARRPLESGDAFHMDCYGSFGGYYWDFGRVRVAGDEPTDVQLRMMEANIAIVHAVCEAIRPGVRACDAHAAGAAVAAEHSIVAELAEEPGETEGFPALGHGYGVGFEGPWIAPDDETELMPGMAIACETLFGRADVGGTFFEENGVVTEDGFEILSDVRERWW
jgi:Xaa-Pro aminopeptidase